MTTMIRNSSSSAIGSNTNHSSELISSSSHHSNRGTLVSITVRTDDAHNKHKKAGIKLQQDSKGRVTVKNIASNGLFGNTELEVGDIILSVNGKRLSDGEAPNELMKWVHKYNTITVSVRKPSPLGLSLTSSASFKMKKDDKKKKKSMKKVPKKDNKIVTFTAEKHTTAADDNVGLVLEIRNKDQLVVKDILPTSIFAASTATTGCSENVQLEIGDRIVCINDMSFRQFADVEYAYCVLNKAKIVVTLVVEKQQSKKTKKKKKNSISSTSKNIPKSSFHNDDDDDDDDATSATSCTTKSNIDDCDDDGFYGSHSNHGTGSLKETKNKERRSLSSFATNSSRYEFDIESDFKIEKYRPVTITVPKPYKWACSTDSIGVQFKVVATNAGDALHDVEQHDDFACESRRTMSWIAVHKIDEKDSLFRNTPLKVGDKVISINDTDLRESTKNGDHHRLVDPRKAYNACLKAKEFITMIVLKDDETVFLEKSFCFDSSVTNLEWE